MPITLKQQKDYKSITNFSTVKLPDFTIITGLNGTGKSHLLESLQAGNHSVLVISDNHQQLNNVRYINSASLAPNNSPQVNTQQLHENRLNNWNAYKNFLTQHRQNPSLSIQSQLGGIINILEDIANECDCDIFSVSELNFYKYYPVEDNHTTNDIFGQSFSYLFKRYHTKFEDNLVDEYRFHKYNEGGYLSRDKFNEKYGPPPWELVNRVLKESNLTYEVNDPESTHRDAPFTLELKNTITGVKINFADLSSGEKVLVSMALSLYNLDRQVNFPEVLVLDEPDAPLHPSMTAQFLRVLQKVFVEEKRVKVLMTTHSPSTVALSPDDSIYLMSLCEPRLKKVERDQALSVLTSGVPTLSVAYENRRQVFVESKYDVSLYEALNSKLLKLRPNEISLNFLCVKNDGSSGCTEVKSIVKKLNDSGNSQVFGIIDWDKKNRSKGNLKVIGEKARYSIENYIFDPLIFAIYLIREKFQKPEEYGFTEKETYISVKDFDQHRLQRIVDSFINKIGSIKPTKANQISDLCYTIGNHTLEVPKWYLIYQGHDLEQSLKIIFKPLQKFQREGELKMDIMNKVMDDIPELISLDFVNLFDAIRSTKTNSSKPSQLK